MEYWNDGIMENNFFFKKPIIGGPVKSRLTGEPRIRSGAGTGVQGFHNWLKLLDSGFRRNDDY